MENKSEQLKLLNEAIDARRNGDIDESIENVRLILNNYKYLAEEISCEMTSEEAIWHFIGSKLIKESFWANISTPEVKYKIGYLVKCFKNHLRDESRNRDPNAKLRKSLRQTMLLLFTKSKKYKKKFWLNDLKEWTHESVKFPQPYYGDFDNLCETVRAQISDYNIFYQDKKGRCGVKIEKLYPMIKEIFEKKQLWLKREELYKLISDLKGINPSHIKIRYTAEPNAYEEEKSE